MNVLILGHTGMLGHMVVKHLENKGCDVKMLHHRWPSNEFKTSVQESKASYLINCIGAIPQKKSNFDINHELPIWLDKNFQGRVIHSGTDCEMDNDDYGISKKKASDWIKQNGKRTKIIKTSIIGFEKQSNDSLMSWFLSNKDGDEVNGYVNHYWNGNTTYFWAKQSDRMMSNWQEYDVETVLYSDRISKYELLNTINKVFGREIRVNSFCAKKDVDRCLIGNVKLPSIECQLEEMREYLVNDR